MARELICRTPVTLDKALHQAAEAAKQGHDFITFKIGEQFTLKGVVFECVWVEIPTRKDEPNLLVLRPIGRAPQEGEPK